MSVEMDTIDRKLADRTPLSEAEVDAVVSTPDILWLGQLADARRRITHDDRVTFVRVHEVDALADGATMEPVPPGAGEVRIVARPATMDEAVALAGRIVAAAAGHVVTAYALDHLADVVDGDVEALARGLEALREAGVGLVAEAPAEAPDLVAWLDAARGAGVGVARLVVREAGDGATAVIRAVAGHGAALAGVHAFSPLPCLTTTHPTTGYADLRQVALARLLVDNIESIQVDWSRYGPKLAQVALTFGADDLDRVSPLDDVGQGRRRQAREEVTRNIRAAGLVPEERTGRFERRDA